MVIKVVVVVVCFFFGGGGLLVCMQTRIMKTNSIALFKSWSGSVFQ